MLAKHLVLSVWLISTTLAKPRVHRGGHFHSKELIFIVKLKSNAQKSDYFTEHGLPSFEQPFEQQTQMALPEAKEPPQGVDNKAMKVLHDFDPSFLNGFVIRVDSASKIAKLLADDRVEFVAEDQAVRVRMGGNEGGPGGKSQMSIFEERLTPGKRRTDSGHGVDIYIVDTGVNMAHKEFQVSTSDSPRRIACGWSITGDDCKDKSGTGHGTAVAGLAGGLHHSAAQSSNLISIKVFNTEGKSSVWVLLAGLEHAFLSVQTSGRPSIVTLAVGPESRHPVLDEIVEKMIASNIHVIAAAGNRRRDASMSSPYSSDMISVGALAIDRRATVSSNKGASVSFWAPGEGIQSTSATSVVMTRRGLKGTSMAAGLVAGVAAATLSCKGSNFKPAALIKEMQKNAVFIDGGYGELLMVPQLPEC